jgi:hypothetical protein
LKETTKNQAKDRGREKMRERKRYKRKGERWNYTSHRKRLTYKVNNYVCGCPVTSMFVKTSDEEDKATGKLLHVTQAGLLPSIPLCI